MSGIDVNDTTSFRQHIALFFGVQNTKDIRDGPLLRRCLVSHSCISAFRLHNRVLLKCLRCEDLLIIMSDQSNISLELSFYVVMMIEIHCTSSNQKSEHSFFHELTTSQFLGYKVQTNPP